MLTQLTAYSFDCYDEYKKLKVNFASWNKKMKNKFSRGFTLIELLVVIAIIGVLASGVLVAINPLEQIKKARDAQRKQDLAQIQKPLEVYYNDNGRDPTLLSALSSQ